MNFHASLNRVFAFFFALFLSAGLTELSAQRLLVHASVDRAVVQRGDTLTVDVRVSGGTGARQALHAVLLKPGCGIVPLLFTETPRTLNSFYSKVVIDQTAAEGLYGVHAWIGDTAHPSAVGKASFRLGNMVVDFFIASYLDSTKPQNDLQDYLDDFQRVGGNFLIAHNLITTPKVYYPSKICKTDVQSGSPNDVVERVLASAEKRGIGVLLSVGWDMTRSSHFKDRMNETKAILHELYDLYKHHPSLVGFYSWQEGSGTYYASFIREFSEHVKTLNSNLLVACAPHIDDPLLAGYLSTIESLDIIIYQAGVMASYRTDNRKKYPHRRVRDFCGLGSGAKRLQRKIAINHVELFGYLEQQLHPNTTATTYENIHRQILSAATVTDADGLSLFSYHAHVFSILKRDRRVVETRKAVMDGVEAYRLITSQVSSRRNDIAVYVPYSDWIVERWPNYFLPALDAFRVLGVPVDILPYAPPVEESVYPYYPYNMNRDVLVRLLKERTVLVLPNVSGFQQTDSDLIEAYVLGGGVVVAFGPQIPMGRSYDRTELFGIKEDGEKTYRYVAVEQPVGRRASVGKQFSLSAGTFARWTPLSAQVVAVFDDGSPAAVVNRYGKGLTVSILTDASTAVRSFPDLVLDMIDEGLKTAGHRRVADVHGLNENVDLAAVGTASGGRIALVNHNMHDLEVAVTSLIVKEEKQGEWIDTITGDILAVAGSDNRLEITIPATSFRCLEYRSSSHHR